MEDDLKSLWSVVTKSYRGGERSIHGPEHWRRVERNALLIASRSGADVLVVRLFALFHDSRRENDGYDDGHGARGAAYAASLRGKAYELDDERFELLHYACVWHTDQHHHQDPTIGTCWDADRLDLWRVGMQTNPKYMNTLFGRQLAVRGGVELYLVGEGAPGARDGAQDDQP